MKRENLGEAFVKFTRQVRTVLSSIWTEIEIFNERHDLLDFSVFFQYLFYGLSIYAIGKYSFILLLMGVVVLAVGDRRTSRRERRSSLRASVEESDLPTLQWLREYVDSRPHLREHRPEQDPAELQHVEWVNELVRQTWPHAEPYFRSKLVELLALVSQTLKDKHVMGLSLQQLVGLRLETFRLGVKTPRIDGVRVVKQLTNKHASREHFVLEADIVYIGDAELVLCSQKIKAGIRDLHVKGRVQVDLGPTITKMPLMAGLCIYMLEPPVFDFNTTSVASALDKLTREHFSKALKALLTGVLTKLLVMPNNITVPFVDASAIRCPTPQGAVRVCVVEARNLPDTDLLSKIDPYCIVTLGAEQSVTQCIKNTVNPCWVHWTQFVCTGPPGQGGPDLHFEVMDRDNVRSDNVLLRLRLSTREVQEKKLVDKWVGGAAAGVMGELRVQALWLSFTDDHTQLPVQLAEIAAIQSTSLCRKERKEGTQSFSSLPIRSTNLFSCILLVWLDSAHGLPESSGNWRVTVHAAGSTQHSWSATQQGDGSWAWKQSFIFQLTNICDKLTLKLCSHDGCEVKAKLLMEISDLLNSPRLTTGNIFKTIELPSGRTAKIKLDCSIKILSPAGKAMEDLKVINRKLRESSHSKHILRLGRSVSKGLLSSSPPQEFELNNGESSSTFYTDGGDLMPETGDLSFTAYAAPTASKPNTSPKPSRSPRMTHRPIRLNSDNTTSSYASKRSTRSEHYQNPSDFGNKVRVRSKKLQSIQTTRMLQGNRRSISLENLGKTMPEKQDNLFTKSYKRIKSTTASRLNVKDIFSSSNLDLAHSSTSRSALMLCSGSLDSETISHLLRSST